MSMFRNLIMQQVNADVGLNRNAKQYCNDYGVLSAVTAYCRTDMDIVPYINAWPNLIHSLVTTSIEPWLVSDGIAYIDTGITATINTRVDYIAQFVSGYMVDNINAINGCRVPDQTHARFYPFANGISPNLTRHRFTLGTVSVEYDLGISSRLNVQFNRNGKLYINGEYKCSFAGATFGGYGKIFIFATNRNNSVSWNSREKISRWTTYDGGLLIQDLVPYNINQEEFGMLDILTKQYYKNKDAYSRFTYQQAER